MKNSEFAELRIVLAAAESKQSSLGRRLAGVSARRYKPDLCLTILLMHRSNKIPDLYALY
jgi:hypothetical protein